MTSAVYCRRKATNQTNIHLIVRYSHNVSSCIQQKLKTDWAGMTFVLSFCASFIFVDMTFLCDFLFSSTECALARQSVVPKAGQFHASNVLSGCSRDRKTTAVGCEVNVESRK